MSPPTSLTPSPASASPADFATCWSRRLSTEVSTGAMQETHRCTVEMVEKPIGKPMGKWWFYGISWNFMGFYGI